MTLTQKKTNELSGRGGVFLQILSFGRSFVPGGLVLICALGCSRDPSPVPSSDSAKSIGTLADLERVEDLSEATANRLIEFSEAIRRRDFEKATRYLAPDFVGTPIPRFEIDQAIIAGVRRGEPRLSPGDLEAGDRATSWRNSQRSVYGIRMELESSVRRSAGCCATPS